MGFIKNQERKMGIRILKWQYTKMNRIAPGLAELEEQADKIIAQAHEIARQRGRNLVSIIKDLARNITSNS
jgi:hypothetical protein